MLLKKKILVVNISYPPRAFGGATRVVVDQISCLHKNYPDEFEIVVFTADTHSPGHLKLSVYTYAGHKVYSVRTPLTLSTNWSAENSNIGDLFKQILEFEKPDFIHFHCIQALTASIVIETQKLKIPHFITIHDGWWISDHQFLIDHNGRVYVNGHPPNTVITPNPDIPIEKSLKRRKMLINTLNNSDGVLVVSETFRNIYKINGVKNTILNMNGISAEIPWGPKKTNHTDKVICAHIGGMSDHKGFNLFKTAISSFDGSNIDVLVVDHNKDSTYRKIEFWGNIKVTIIGRVALNEVNLLYQQSDVVFAPSTCVESFGLVTREANACSCWVVASNRGGIADDVNEDNGFVIEPTVEGIRSALLAIDSNPLKYKSLCAKQKIRYSSDQVFELVDLIRPLIKASN